MLKNIIDENLSPSINKPKLLDQLRAIIRTKHYSLRTEESYIQWIKRFIIFHNKRHPNEMSEVEINQFLYHLAVKNKGGHKGGHWFQNDLRLKKSLQYGSL